MKSGQETPHIQSSAPIMQTQTNTLGGVQINNSGGIGTFNQTINNPPPPPPPPPTVQELIEQLHPYFAGFDEQRRADFLELKRLIEDKSQDSGTLSQLFDRVKNVTPGAAIATLANLRTLLGL
ncbi:MAG: hypothetical protein SF002_03695 [Alphaproteobacteria bacterium]|nr:hypothetical protein [Alphaproteobacteria bacterium]